MLVPVSSRVSQGDTTNTSVSKRIINNVEKCFRRSQNISVIATRSSVLTLASKKTRKSFFENQENFQRIKVSQLSSFLKRAETNWAIFWTQFCHQIGDDGDDDKVDVWF